MMELSRNKLIQTAEEVGRIAEEAEVAAIQAERMARIEAGSWLGAEYAETAREKRREMRALTIAAACMLERASAMSDEAVMRLDVIHLQAQGEENGA